MDDESNLQTIFDDIFSNVGYSQTTVSGPGGSTTVSGVTIGNASGTNATPGQIVAAGNPALAQSNNFLWMLALIAVVYVAFRESK